MRYETGMTIVFDVVSKSVLIVFRDEVITLSGPFKDQKTAMKAGEDHCLSKGWIPKG